MTLLSSRRSLPHLLVLLAGAGLALLAAGSCVPPIEEDDAVLTLAVLDPADQAFHSGLYLPFNDVRLGRGSAARVLANDGQLHFAADSGFDTESTAVQWQRSTNHVVLPLAPASAATGTLVADPSVAFTTSPAAAVGELLTD